MKSLAHVTARPTYPAAVPVLAVLALLLAAFVGCREPAPPVGTERGACYGNGTCNDGLMCMSKLCVRPPPPDCAKVAEKLSFLVLSNYARPAERQAYISDMVTTCQQAKLSQPEADCLLTAKNRSALGQCPKPLALGSCERAMAHAHKLVAGSNPALANMMDKGPALRRCQERGISKQEEACVLAATTKEQLDRCGRF